MQQPPQQGYVRRFIDAVRQVIWYVLFGLLVGSVLVWLSPHAKTILSSPILIARGIPDLAEKLLEHVGMGFIVAAIAVLFYEWRAHLKTVENVSRELTALREAVGARALERALKACVNTKVDAHDREVIESITDIVENLKRLKDEGDWAQMGFQRFISAMLKRVSVNAERLAELSSALQQNPASAANRKIDIHTPAELVDTILAEQVGRLRAGGRYSVVTNPQDWQEGQFQQLQEVSKVAVEQYGVVIRRILVLTDSGPNAYRGDPTDVEQILEKHLAAAESLKKAVGGGGYTFKVLDEVEQRRLGKLKDDAAVNVLGNHFALIEPSGTQHCLEVKANEASLDDFQLEGVPRDSQHIKWFNLVWEKLPQLDSPKMQEILNRWKAAHP
jgi:hypothetical protein